MKNMTFTSLNLTEEEFDLLTSLLSDELVDLEDRQERFLSLVRGMRRKRGHQGPVFMEKRIGQVQRLLDRLTA